MKKLSIFVILFLIIVLTQVTPRIVHADCAAYDALGNCTSNISGQATVPTPTPAPTTATPSTAGPIAPCGDNCNLGYTPLEPIPGLTQDQNGNNNYLVSPNNLHNIIDAIFKIMITVGALFAVLMLTVGGIQYMISGSAGEKNIGIKRAQAALWGIVLLAASYLILNTVNPKLLNFNLNPCPDGVNCAETVPPITPTATPTPGNSSNNGNGSTAVPLTIAGPSNLPTDTTYFSASQLQSSVTLPSGDTWVNTSFFQTSSVAAIAVPDSEVESASKGIGGFTTACQNSSGMILPPSDTGQATLYACVGQSTQ